MYETFLIYGGLAAIWVAAWAIGVRTRARAEDVYRARLPEARDAQNQLMDQFWRALAEMRGTPAPQRTMGGLPQREIEAVENLKSILDSTRDIKECLQAARDSEEAFGGALTKFAIVGFIGSAVILLPYDWWVQTAAPLWLFWSVFCLWLLYYVMEAKSSAESGRESVKAFREAVDTQVWSNVGKVARGSTQDTDAARSLVVQER